MERNGISFSNRALMEPLQLSPSRRISRFASVTFFFKPRFDLLDAGRGGVMIARWKAKVINFHVVPSNPAISCVEWVSFSFKVNIMLLLGQFWSHFPL